jgi:hypothetical protein
MVQMLEYQIQRGLRVGTRQAVHLTPLSEDHAFGPELYGSGAVIKLLEAAQQ